MLSIVKQAAWCRTKRTRENPFGKIIQYHFVFQSIFISSLFKQHVADAFQITNIVKEEYLPRERYYMDLVFWEFNRGSLFLGYGKKCWYEIRLSVFFWFLSMLENTVILWRSFLKQASKTHGVHTTSVMKCWCTANQSHIRLSLQFFWPCDCTKTNKQKIYWRVGFTIPMLSWWTTLKFHGAVQQFDLIALGWCYTE